MDLNTTQAAHDDLDDLFNYDVGGEDPLHPPEQTMDAEAPLEPRRPKPIDLGIDEEVIQRKRKPNPKLDEGRLLSQNGIPKLRRITKDRLKFKGKGHEFSDVARILNLYQLWLDDLYPKAKFADGLAMIEKLGHSKRIQTMRKEWINEAKTGRDCESKSPDSDTFANTTGGFGGRDSTQPEVEDTQDGNKLPSGEQREEDSLFVDENGNLLQSSEPDGDELDEPIAEARDLTDIASGRNNHKKSDRAPGTKDAFEERYATEMEMMREFEDW